MDTLALRLAAAGGRIDDLPASQLVAAGFTLLQRSAPLVRMLAGRRSALLLPPGPAAVVALAASDGRGAVVLPLDRSPEELTAHCAASDVGAVFTLASHRDQVPASLGVVLLDAIPRTAMVRTPEGREQMVDLGSHVGLTIEGETDLPGRDEEALLLPATSVLTLTHRALLDFDGLGVEIDPSRSDAAIVTALLIPLLAGRTLRVAS
ncbi:MAG: hypothetical protein ACKN99_03945 [Gemmatimonadota bacterium]